MKSMAKTVLRWGVAALVLTAIAAASVPTAGLAQSSDPKAQEPRPRTGDGREGVPKRIDDITEVGRLLSGPAANPECVWLGRRVISLLWRDDLDTAFRHLDLYDRFGCPSGHIQATFRCLVRSGEIDPKAPDSLNGRIHACWINPNTQPPGQPTAANPPEGATTSR